MAILPLVPAAGATEDLRVLMQIVLFDGFDPLDVIGPFEVLAAGGDAAGGALDVRLVAVDGPGRWSAAPGA